MASQHLRPLGQNQHGLVADSSTAPRISTEDNVTTYQAEPSTSSPGQEVRITVPLQEAPGRHTLVQDIVLEFELKYLADAHDVICRCGADLIREFHVYADNQLVLRVDSQYELGFMLRQQLMDKWYDPRQHAVGWCPPGSDAATGSIVQSGFETLPAADAATYAYKGSSVTGVTTSPYRHRFQISLGDLFNGLFHKFDARRVKSLQFVIQWLATGSLESVGHSIAFDTSAGDYANVSFQNVGARVYRSHYFARPGSLFLPTTQPLKHVLYRYDPAALPIDLTVAGRYEVRVNINSLFPARKHATRLYWALAPAPLADSADIGFAWEAAGALKTHRPWKIQVEYQGQIVQKLQTGWEIERHRRSSKHKRAGQTDESYAHWASPTDISCIDYFDFDCANREVDHGTDLLTGIETSVSGAAQEYVLVLSSNDYRPAVTGSPTQLWLWLESQMCLTIEPGSNLSGAGAKVHVY